MNKLLISAMALVVLAFSTAAMALPTTNFDFAAYADVNGESAYAPTFDWTKDGITVTASGSYLGNDVFAYLDASSGGPGGLGVCRAVDGTQCAPNSDDNVTSGETLHVALSGTSTINWIEFRNADHGTAYSPLALVDISVDGGAFASYTLENIFNTSLSGTHFDFRFNNGEFYIKSMNVPEPGPLALLGLGLIGLYVAGRKKAA